MHGQNHIKFASEIQGIIRRRSLHSDSYCVSLFSNALST